MASLHVNDNGILRRIRRVFVNDGGQLLELREAYVNHGGILRRVFEQLSIAWDTSLAQLSGENVGGNCTANVFINHDGTTTANADNESFDSLTGQDWHSLAPSLEDGTDPWTIQFDHVSGTNFNFPGLAEGVEHFLDANLTFTLVNTLTNNDGLASYTMTIDDKEGNIVVKPINFELVSGTPVI